jgi:hypothetical protein
MLFFIGSIITVAGSQNSPPSIPEINGPTSGKVGVEYNYTFVSTDPEGDDIYYYVCWGCCGSKDIHEYGPYESGVEIIQNHSWSEKGNFIIKAYAKDINEAESDWGTFEVSMPRNLISINTIIQRLFERFPNAFSMLRLLFHQLG